jgi:hypothetical protein
MKIRVRCPLCGYLVWPERFDRIYPVEIFCQYFKARGRYLSTFKYRRNYTHVPEMKEEIRRWIEWKIAEMEKEVKK